MSTDLNLHLVENENSDGNFTVSKGDYDASLNIQPAESNNLKFKLFIILL